MRRRIRFLGYPLRGEERFRPFFIIGVGRSGNTLFRRILTAHSELHIPPETFVLGECIRKFKRYGRWLDWPDAVSLIMGLFAFHPEFHTFEMSLEPLVDRLTRASREKRNLAFILDGFYRYHAELNGRPKVRWGDKTPLNSLDDALFRGDWPRRIGRGVPQTLERLLRVFPDAQFLHIYRDGCDVASSFLRGGFVTSANEAGRRWLHTIRQTRRFVRNHAERCCEVRYEELVTRSAETIRSVCTFLGVELEPGMLSSEESAAELGDIPEWSWHSQAQQPINAANPGKGRRLFSSEEKEGLQGLIGAELESLGYPAVC